MKLWICIMMFLITANFARSQDSTLLITAGMMNATYDFTLLTDKGDWLFKQGHDPSFAEKDIPLTGWKKLKPVEISSAYADSNGRVEGWFRLKIRLDSSFLYRQPGFRMSSFAASELFVDGKLISSQGNPGTNGKPYAGNKPFNQVSIPVGMEPGRDYLIAIHFVDYVTSFPVKRLRSEIVGLDVLIRLTGPGFNAAILRGIREAVIFNILWIVTTTVISLLFFLLVIQNPREKNIRLMAFTCLALACVMFFETSGEGLFNLNYNGFLRFRIGANLAFPILLGLVPPTIAGIFQKKMSVLSKIFLFVSCVVAAVGYCFEVPWLILAAVVYVVGSCLYYIISSWKSLKGAQWTVVIGLIISLLFGLLYIILSELHSRDDLPYYYFYITAFCLAFPVSLLIYVAKRFKEIIAAVEYNAQKVIHLSAEKEQQAVNQQRILEAEVQRQTAEIRTAMDNLKETQAQLIQSEKMASLGELTAGIAHEIQNPLNFVNNFSEVNKELLTDLTAEIEKRNYEEVKIIARDIISNEEKINHHGRRADSIVKGMLQHSRSSSSQKESTDINALADEYLRLAYHGLRAKDKSFNALLKTDFDETIGKINLIPQEIGRVLLNVYNNAFYAVNEKRKTAEAPYEPEVAVQTKRMKDSILISIKDNGTGIPPKLVDKIFQPFFTTKPTGHGTGLGLSLAYDIVKVHGGEIKIQEAINGGTVFKISIPFL